ncbi:hypothetical protein PTKIN_Ptkin05aG0192600 [Pterospermum kingtungense]
MKPVSCPMLCSFLASHLLRKLIRTIFRSSSKDKFTTFSAKTPNHWKPPQHRVPPSSLTAGLSSTIWPSLMMLHFGSVPVLVVSSADAAREIMKTHDLTFANRPKSISFQKLFYDCKDEATEPYGEYWRQMKSICVLHLLSNTKVQFYRTIREEEMALAIEKIIKRSFSDLTVNLSELFSVVTNNIISRVTLGRKYDGEDRKKFKKLLHELTEL